MSSFIYSPGFCLLAFLLFLAYQTLFQMTSSAVINTAAIAFTEKKVDMALDDIIKMSKTKTTNSKKQMVSNKSHKFSGGNGTQKSLKVRKFMQSRSTIRQGVLAQRRSNFQGNRFPMATEAAKNAIVAPIRNGDCFIIYTNEVDC